MDPKEDPAFPIPTWQTTLDLIKDSATARIVELRTQHDGDGEAMAKILVYKNRIKDTKCWRQYNGNQKNVFFEFSCPFRGKRHATSGTSSPFTLIQINDLKESYFRYIFILLLFLVFDLFFANNLLTGR